MSLFPRSRVEHAQAEAEARENELKLRVDDLEVANKEREEELQKVKEEWAQEVCMLQIYASVIYVYGVPHDLCVCVFRYLACSPRCLKKSLRGLLSN